MFGWKKNQDHSGTIASIGPITSIIGEAMRVVGDLDFKGGARIDGSIEGNVLGEALLLSQSGWIQGNVEAQTVISQGTIAGNISAKHLTIRKGAVITGCIDADDLLVEQGAVVNGEIKTRMREKDQGLAQATGNTKVEAEETASES